MKRLSICLLCVVLGLALTACTSRKEEGEESLSEAAESHQLEDSREAGTADGNEGGDDADFMPETAPVEVPPPPYESSWADNPNAHPGPAYIPDEDDAPFDPNSEAASHVIEPVEDDGFIPTPDPSAPLGSPENPIAEEMTDSDLLQ